MREQEWNEQREGHEAPVMKAVQELFVFMGNSAAVRIDLDEEITIMTGPKVELLGLLEPWPSSRRARNR